MVNAFIDAGGGRVKAATSVLVVNLDGTLIRTDMLFESFWSAFGRDWRSPFLSLAALLRGRAELKRHLARSSEVDASTLPYDMRVIAFVEEWRKSGGRTALVTSSDSQFAESVAEHLCLFDEVHGSDGIRNLKGDVKAEFLVNRFGEAGFAYMGDAAADLPVWKRAAKAITVNLSSPLRREVDQCCETVEHLDTKPTLYVDYLRAMRPHQWLKNTLVFLPMLASHRLDGPAILSSLLAFLCFCLIASSVYILNDMLDLSADRAHPRRWRHPASPWNVDGSRASRHWRNSLL